MTGPVDEQPDEGWVVTAEIRIRRLMSPEGRDRVHSKFSDGTEDGPTPSAVELLGLLEMTKDSVLNGGIYDEDDG